MADETVPAKSAEWSATGETKGASCPRVIGAVKAAAAAAPPSYEASGTGIWVPRLQHWSNCNGEEPMNGIIYLVGLVVVIIAVLSFFGLR